MRLGVDDDHPRARKRQRTDDIPTMRLPESDQDSQHSNSISPDFTPPAMEAGPSSRGLDGPTIGANGRSLLSLSPTTNGHSAANGVAANGVHKNGKGTVARVHIPGTLLHDDMSIDREEFVRLVVQSLRDVGYMYVIGYQSSLITYKTLVASSTVPLPTRLSRSRDISWNHQKYHNLDYPLLKESGQQPKQC